MKKILLLSLCFTLFACGESRTNTTDSTENIPVCETCDGTQKCQVCDGWGVTNPYGFTCNTCRGLGTCQTCCYGKSWADLLHEGGINVPSNIEQHSRPLPEPRKRSCGRCSGTGRYKWFGVTDFGNVPDNYMNCPNCGEVIKTTASHSCTCRNCGGTGKI